MSLTTDDYLDAFLHGFEFVLMAMEGRLASRHFRNEAEVREFLEEYKQLLRMHQARRQTEPAVRLVLSNLPVAELEPPTQN